MIRSPIYMVKWSIAESSGSGNTYTPSAQSFDGLVNFCSTLTLLVIPVMCISTLVSRDDWVNSVLSLPLYIIDPVPTSLIGLVVIDNASAFLSLKEILAITTPEYNKISTAMESTNVIRDPKPITNVLTDFI